MIKALLIDLDGVIIQARHKYFSDRLAEEHSIPLEEILKFFKNEYGQAARGKLSIRDVLPAYLETWGWQGSLDEFLLYWFEGETELAKQVVADIQKIREQGVKVYIASDNEQERATYLMDELDLGSLVDGTFFSYEVGMKKSEPKYFSHVLDQLGLAPKDVMYIDDDPENVAIGKEVGIESVVYKPEVSISELKLK